ncbi:MAG: DUF4382 domain-containing protein [Flammeovirgaceae bacterium]|nr:DUF4382 domain-containing protein [Flammeovirgaceae bacterium]
MKKLIVSLFAVAALILASCDSDERSARLQVWLTDAPGDYEEVNVDIQGVEIHAQGGDQNNGWQSLEVNKGIYNLLDLTNGLDTLLGEIELPAGKISQVRLVLGDDNSIKVDGATHDLTTPSGQQSGLKVQIHQDLVEGITYKILLDFDAAKSIVNTGSAAYILKPVIRSITEATSGAIKGLVEPVVSSPAIYAIAGDDTVSTTFPDQEGKFLMKGIEPGTYQVHFIPASGFQSKVVADVAVTLGVVADLETVTIQQE